MHRDIVPCTPLYESNRAASPYFHCQFIAFSHAVEFSTCDCDHDGGILLFDFKHVAPDQPSQ